MSPRGRTALESAVGVVIGAAATVALWLLAGDRSRGVSGDYGGAGGFVVTLGVAGGL